MIHSVVFIDYFIVLLKLTFQHGVGHTGKKEMRESFPRNFVSWLDRLWHVYGVYRRMCQKKIDDNFFDANLFDANFYFLFLYFFLLLTKNIQNNFLITWIYSLQGVPRNLNDALLTKSLFTFIILDFTLINCT